MGVNPVGTGDHISLILKGGDTIDTWSNVPPENVDDHSKESKKGMKYSK